MKTHRWVKRILHLLRVNISLNNTGDVGFKLIEWVEWIELVECAKRYSPSYFCCLHVVDYVVSIFCFIMVSYFLVCPYYVLGMLFVNFI